MLRIYIHVDIHSSLNKHESKLLLGSLKVIFSTLQSVGMSHDYLCAGMYYSLHSSVYIKMSEREILTNDAHRIIINTNKGIIPVEILRKFQAQFQDTCLKKTQDE